jgi:hypothetical protein
MPTHASHASAHDSPLGDRDGADERWTPERVEDVTNQEVKNPEDDSDRDEDPLISGPNKAGMREAG